MNKLNSEIAVDKREYGIDLVKIISTFLVIMTHLFTYGGFKENLEPWTFKYFCAGFLQAVTLCCVNLFGLSTGYLYFNKKVKISKIFQLWIQIVFITFAALLIFTFINRDLGIIKQNIIPTFLPVINGSFWFFNSYLVLFFLINYYNRVIDNISKREYIILLSTMFVLFVIVPLIAGKDVFKFTDGYSFVWLSFLYFFGAYFRKYEIVKKANAPLCAVGCFIIFLIVPLYRSFYSIHPITFLSGDYRLKAQLYNSITITVASLLLFLLISKIKINNGVLKKVMITLSPVSFLVYIIHSNSFVFSTFIVDKLGYFSDYPAGIMILRIFLYTLMIFVPCSIIGILIIKLFKLVKVDKICDWAEELLRKTFNRFCREE